MIVEIDGQQHAFFEPTGKLEEFDLRKTPIKEVYNYKTFAISFDAENLSWPMTGSEKRETIREYSPVDYFFELPILLRAFVSGFEMQTKRQVCAVRFYTEWIDVPDSELRHQPFTISDTETEMIVRYCLPFTGTTDNEMKQIPNLLREVAICSIFPNQYEIVKRRIRKYPKKKVKDSDISAVTMTDRRKKRLDEHLKSISGR